MSEFIEYPAYKLEQERLYNTLKAGYGDRMLEREHFNDICTNVANLVTPFIKLARFKEIADSHRLALIDELMHRGFWSKLKLCFCLLVSSAFIIEDN